METGSRQETRQIKKLEPRFDSIETEKAPASRPALPVLPVAMMPMMMTPMMMTPMPVMPVPMIAPMVMVVVPAHFGGHLPGVILNRGGGAGTGQRQGLGAFGGSGQHEQCGDGRKPQNSHHVHMFPPLVIGRHASDVRLIWSTASPQRRS
jgi:hypothetical protein